MQRESESSALCDVRIWSYKAVYVLERTFIAATNNKKKLAELRTLLSVLGIGVESPEEAGISVSPEETGGTFEENAFIKADAVCALSGRPAIADDSGLCVDALGGEPGVLSARFGGENLSDAERTAFLLEKLKSVPEGKRTARFVCAVCAVFPSGDIIRARGSCEGKILFEPEGENGFGYDPVFSGETGVSFGSLARDEKNAISHRARALAQFSEKLKKYYE